MASNNNHFLAIVNPAAGFGKCALSAPSALESLRNAGLNVEQEQTSRAGDAVEIARRAFRRGIRNFIAVGGDGTSFEIVNGLFPESTEEKETVSLGFLPLGTGNSFLRDFSTQGVSYSSECLRTGRQRSCDVLKAIHSGGEVYFINLLSLGFVAQVGDTVNRRFKRLGEAGYIFGVLSEVAQLSPCALPHVANGFPAYDLPMSLLSVNNSKYTGGKMMMAPAADPTDGKLDLIEVEHLGRLGLLAAFPKIFAGTHVNHPRIRASQTDRIEFNFASPVAAMIDGEVLDLQLQSIEVLPRALNVYA